MIKRANTHLSVEINRSLLAELKIYAVTKERSIKSIIVELIEKKLEENSLKIF